MSPKEILFNFVMLKLMSSYKYTGKRAFLVGGKGGDWK